MVTTFEILPAPPLAPYICRYVYREFDTNGLTVTKPWVASQENGIYFFFNSLPIKLANPVSGKVIKEGKPCDILGMSSAYNGDMYFNGAYSFFQIIFKPDGFYQLFKIPSAYLINQIICGEDIFSAGIKLLQEQLYMAVNPLRMAALADVFLFSYLKKQKSICSRNGISSAVHLIAKNAGFINVDALAQNANMSIRNFERLFQVATGMTPKLLCCVTRFNRALQLKLQNAAMDWTSVAYQTGYFDQMHLIKDFKRFSGETPKTLLKDTFLFEEDCTLAQ